MGIGGKNKLWKSMMKNYLLLIAIMLGLCVAVLIFIGAFSAFLYKDSVPKLIAGDIIKDDYKHINASDVIKNNGWAEVIDSNYRVIYVYGTKKTKSYKYSKETFFNMIMNQPEKYFYTTAYSKAKHFILLAAYPSSSVEVKLNFNGQSPYAKPLLEILLIGAAVFILFFMGSIYFYSKVTSKTFIIPLKELATATKAIMSGEYGKQVELNFKNNNEIEELKETFNEMSKKLKMETDLRNDSEKNRRQILLNISHDLKNPITSALGYSGLLAEKNISKEETERYSKIIYNNCQRANYLAVNLFEFSHLESEGFSLKCKEQDICEFMRKLIADFIPRLEDKGFIYDFSIPDEILTASFDENNLYRAISNIIDNAIKYNNGGTKIDISLTSDNDKKKIVIKDNGCGIAKELAAYIMEPFVRVDKARNSSTGGTGLGLSIANMIIKKHGGSMELISDIGKGCCFIINL